MGKEKELQRPVRPLKKSSHGKMIMTGLKTTGFGIELTLAGLITSVIPPSWGWAVKALDRVSHVGAVSEQESGLLQEDIKGREVYKKAKKDWNAAKANATATEKMAA